MKWKMALGIILLVCVGIVPLSEAKSLWSEGSPTNQWLIGANASKVGEIVTIIIQEDNRANDTSDGKGSRKHDVNGVVGMIWNNPFMKKLFGGNGADNAPSLKWNSSNAFSGETAVDRASQFTSRVAATIVRIDEVGNFLIEARKSIRVGQEQKTIVLSGKVRPRDISLENTVISYQVADAEISYLGDGTITKMANPSLFQTFFNFLF